MEKRFRVLLGLVWVYGFALSVLGASQGVLMFNTHSINSSSVSVIIGGVLIQVTILSYLWRVEGWKMLWVTVNLVFTAGFMASAQIAHTRLHPVVAKFIAEPLFALTVFSWGFLVWSFQEDFPSLIRQALSSVKHSRRWQYVLLSPFLAYVASRLPVENLKIAIGGILLFSALPVAVWKIESHKEDT